MCPPSGWVHTRVHLYKLQPFLNFYERNFIENISVGRASVQWGGRPRPPTDMAARDGRPTNTSHFSSFVVSARK